MSLTPKEPDAKLDAEYTVASHMKALQPDDHIAALRSAEQLPEKDQVYDAYRKYVNPPLTRVMKISGSPIEWRAEGCTIWDTEGKGYLDFAGGYGVFTLGHRHPKIIAAVQTQLQYMAMSSKTMFNPVMAELARRLALIAPGNVEISFFTNSGAEAIEAALKLARAATGRGRIVATQNAYHGKTLGALSVSGRAVFRQPFGALLPEVVHVPFGDSEALAANISGAAAFIVEPIQAEGGVIIPPAGYLQTAQQMCREAGALLIIDEVQTGLGRCGARFACDVEAIEPDILTLAKGLSGGVVPIGACIATPAAWNAAYRNGPLLHTSTFGGNQLACAAALAALDVLEEEDLVSRSAARGQQLLSGVRVLAERYPEVIGAVRGRGLLVGVELRHEGYGGALIPELLKRGVTAAWTLNQQRVIRLEPPLIVSENEVDRALVALDAALAASRERLAGRLAEPSATNPNNEAFV